MLYDVPRYKRLIVTFVLVGLKYETYFFKYMVTSYVRKKQIENMNSKKIIVHFITTLDVGGAENMLSRLVNEEQKFIHKIICLKKLRTTTIVDTIACHIFFLNLSFNPLSWFKIFKLYFFLKKTKPSLFVCWMYHSMFLGTLIGKLLGVRVIWNIRQTLYNLNFEKKFTALIIRITQFFVGYPQKIIYNSLVSQQQHTALGYPLEKSIFIPNGFNTSTYYFDPLIRSNIRNNLNIDKDDIVIGHVARFHSMKGHVHFVETLLDLLEVYQGKRNIHVLMAGKGVDKLNVMLAEKILKSPFRKKFHLVGQIKSCQDVLSSLDLVCVTSLWGEAFSNVIGEAMCSQTFVVSSEVGDAPYILPKEWIYRPGDNKQLLSIIENFLNLSLEDKNLILKNNYDHLQNNFEIHNVVKSYYDLFENCLQGLA